MVSWKPFGNRFRALWVPHCCLGLEAGLEPGDRRHWLGRVATLQKHQDLAPIPSPPHHHLTKMASPPQVSLAVKGWTKVWTGRELKPLPIVPAAAVDVARWGKKEEEEDGGGWGLPYMWGAGSKAKLLPWAQSSQLLSGALWILPPSPIISSIVPLHTWCR